MRRGLLALALVLVLVAAACGGDESTKKEKGATVTTGAERGEFPAGSTMAAIQSRGRIVVGVKFDQPGFGQKNPVTGDVEGLDVEMAKLVARKIDPALKIEFVESVSKNREPFIEAGKVDIVVATYTITPERKERVDFAGPYFVALQDIMVKAGDTTIKSVEDLNGKAVCTAKGSTSAKNLEKKAPRAQVVLFDTYSQCAEGLTDGRVVAVTTDNTILAGLVGASQGAFKLVEAPFSDEPYGIGLKKGDDVFRAFINDVIEDSYGDGTWAAAFEATLGTFGVKTPAPPPVDRYPSTAGGSATTTAP